MKQRVILINPPVIDIGNIHPAVLFRVPQGLLYLGTLLEEKNVDVKIIDAKVYCEHHLPDFIKGGDRHGFFDYIENGLLNEIDQFKPNMVGVGCLFSMSFTGLKIISEKIKGRFPNIPIVIGGIHPTTFPAEILEKYDFIDYVIIGEGENAMVELVENMDKKGNISKMDGIAFRKDEKVQLNPKKIFQQDINEWPFVDYDLLKMDDYKRDTSDWYSPNNIPINQPYSMLTSRSCPNQCTFCCTHLVHGKRIRFRTPENVLEEMEQAYYKNNVRYFTFIDDNLTFNRARTVEIFKGIIDRKMKIQFDTAGGIAIKSLNQEVVDIMVEAGMVKVNLAIESGSEFIRNKIMKKKLKTEKIYEISEACAKHKKLFITGYFVLGYPEETLETIEETFNLIKKVALDSIALYYAMPYPGTELFHQCIKHKLLPFDAEDYLDADYTYFKATAEPQFKPFNIEKQDLIEFKKKVDDYIKEKRDKCKYPANYPIRYEE